MKQFLQFAPARGSSLPIYCLQNRRNDSLNLRKGILNDDRIERGIGHAIEIFNATDFTGVAEVAEGVILSAQRDHEEKKLRLYGNLIANLAFYPQFSRAAADLVVRLAERLSYRQLCLLALFCQPLGYHERLWASGYSGTAQSGPRLALLFEIFDLVSRGLIRRTDGTFLLSEQDIIPAKMETHSIGYSLFVLMELSTPREPTTPPPSNTVNPEIAQDLEEIIAILAPEPYSLRGFGKQTNDYAR